MSNSSLKDTNAVSRRQGNTRLMIVVVFGIVAVAWVGFLRWSLPPITLQSGGLSNTTSFRAASYDWRMKDLEGNPIDFAQFKGKTVFLNIWATWCPPCVAELPSINRLAQTASLKDVVFLCVSLDGDLSAPRGFIKSKPLVPQVLWTEPEQMPAPYRTDGIPATFIISKSGAIEVAEVGSSQWDRPEVIALLERMVKS